MTDAIAFRDGTSRGRAVFAARDLLPGDRLLVEAPLISMPIPESRTAILACERCCQPTGTISSQLQHLCQKRQLPTLPIEDDSLAGDEPCRRHCGARFCGVACEAAAAPSHDFLCGGRSAAADSAMRRFEENALGSHEVFLFGARVVADILARAKAAGTACAVAAAAYDPLCRVPWWDISDDGVAKTKSERLCVRREADVSRSLLLDALLVDASAAKAKAVREWLSLEEWGGLLGAARRNSICVCKSHPVDEFVAALQEWSAEQTAGSARAVDGLLHALPTPIPDATWTALYDRMSCVNHACRPKYMPALSQSRDHAPCPHMAKARTMPPPPPAQLSSHPPTRSAEVHFLGEDHMATLIATRAVAAGDEIFISYIDHNERGRLEDRRASLRDYGFECDCDKCTAEESWRRRLRQRLEPRLHY